MLLEQQGRCYYSDIVLRYSNNDDWCFSCERLDTTQGYTRNNCVLIAREFQTSINWSRDIVKHFRNNIYEKIPMKENNKFLQFAII